MSERLWAPWRMAYVGQEQPETGCLFCRVASEAEDDGNLVVARNGLALLMLNAYPYTNGHLMAVPTRHTADFESLSPEEILATMSLVQSALSALTDVYHPHGFNVGLNLGSAAGAGIAEHLHVHIVPRWAGDTNFMASVGDVRVLPEDLKASRQKIENALRHVKP